MKVEIKVPAMGESITEATVGTIIKANGSKVQMDDEVLELETDKVNQVLYAPQTGVVTLTVNTDDVVQIGQVIGQVDTEGAETAAPAPPAEKPAAPVEALAPTPVVPTEPSGETVRHTKEAFIQEVIAPAPKTPESVPASPPTTPPKEKPQPAVTPIQSQDKRETRRRMSRIRRVIADRLVEAQQTTAMLTTFNEVDLSEVIALRSKYKDYFVKEYGAKLGFMSFFVKACISALMSFPDLNSYIDGDSIVHREYYDVGIAVGTDRGLIVPVLRDCDKLSFAEIEKAIVAFANKAREGTIAVDDLQGGGFTITNGGVYGSLLSTPILNPPQCGILGMHKIQKRPVVVNDEIVIRPMMYLAMSYDHRIVDGKEAVSFLIHIKDCLEDPSRILIGV